ncbi:BMP family ABC transporter substrate-binding protein [Rhodobacteraceae bacterium 2376]|uniref:BMP family ABC transporter substrate-binding protein n=1 Tax=Rhabdonatronobacter sediminivivens TaxID=2743469 RepID=A0A7Z0KX86_9RHOB|nr:BMP family ABC transporter substrate-binding protein [Rhabdonatronobacter sediminivivens]NYS24244.1 BMP family ABC transporter substrate-binding protein [Rhabdonatronobacter sediminivivens]
MKRRHLLASAAVVAGLAFPAMADDPTKAGFIYIGPVGDHGWTFTHDQAREALEEHFGDAVETSYVENVNYGPDAERIMTQMALSGTDIIFATSFGYGPDVNNVAARFPDVAFEHATGYIQEADNVSLYNARFYEGRAVIGHIAGKMTETNTIGYIASFPIPEVIMGINSAYLHAKAVNPDVEFRVVWVYSWYDPAQEAAAAEALIEQGADILMQHTDSTAPVTVAQDQGIFAFGQASDMTAFAPESHLTAILDVWDPYYIDRVQAVMDGTWEAGDIWHGIVDGMVGFAPMNDAIPEDIRAEAEEMIAAISAGEYHPFTGPINRQDGSAWLAEGETAPDGDLLTMDFYVEGMTGEVPN